LLLLASTRWWAIYQEQLKCKASSTGTFFFWSRDPGAGTGTTRNWNFLHEILKNTRIFHSFAHLEHQSWSIKKQKIFNTFLNLFTLYSNKNCKWFFFEWNPAYSSIPSIPYLYLYPKTRIPDTIILKWCVAKVLIWSKEHVHCFHVLQYYNFLQENS
jgi:hypothetical protein